MSGGGGQLSRWAWSIVSLLSHGKLLFFVFFFKSEMVLKPRAAVGITILQHYTSLLEWDSLFVDLYLE